MPCTSCIVRLFVTSPFRCAAPCCSPPHRIAPARPAALQSGSYRPCGGGGLSYPPTMIVSNRNAGPSATRGAGAAENPPHAAYSGGQPCAPPAIRPVSRNADATFPLAADRTAKAADGQRQHIEEVGDGGVRGRVRCSDLQDLIFEIPSPRTRSIGSTADPAPGACRHAFTQLLNVRSWIPRSRSHSRRLWKTSVTACTSSLMIAMWRGV
jgi:hypothetical protein